MRKKFTLVFLSAIVGVASGAWLGFGPLLKYKSEGLLSMPMGTVDYKRVNEFAHNSDVMREYLSFNPAEGVEIETLGAFVRSLNASNWSVPVPSLSRSDIKDLPSLPLPLPKDNDKNKDKDKDKNKDKDKDNAVEKAYLGVALSVVAHDPVQAANVTRWLGNYYKEASALVIVRDLVNRWTADNMDFANRALEEKIKLDFSIAQLQSRAAALKQLMTRYPNTNMRENQQVLDVRKENEKFMSPLAQLVAAESEIIGLQVDMQKLEREMAQYKFAQALAAKATQALAASRSGSESITNLAEVIQQLSKQTQTDAEQEKLLAFAADLSEIEARFLSRAQFVAEPSVPTRPQGLGPFKIMALMGFLAMLISAAWVMRKTLLKLLQDDAEPPRQGVSSAA